MTDRFLFSILSTVGIISGATSLSFGSAYAVGKYMPRPKPAKYFPKKISRITSIEDIQEYEDIQGCTFLFKTGINPALTKASTGGKANTQPTSNNSSTTVLGYESLEGFRNKNKSIGEDKIVVAAEGKRSNCNHGSAVYVDITS
ncbi:hypothetical protein HF1_05570 [Mycoplasma haemofelis str. Langford 1]|uniref:Uncharacterized protein n=1 Tax=Mycoplasma haemofelis (strain Langford 1) TaxID=941640 RepID=E8ZHE4_MYCHL|nr:hypothetical protein [Mycoplasma haemofelis]CBY92565.1 hypothetical protein HF1_05570 [Mycoplasma haemofelis str. Langford 1]